MLFKTGCLKRCIPQPSALRAQVIWTSFGGDGRDRTDDLKLAKLPLSQLSYVPLKPSNPTKAKSFQRLCWSESRAPNLVGLGRLELPTSRLSGVRSNHLSYRPDFHFAEAKQNQCASSTQWLCHRTAADNGCCRSF